LVYSFRHLCTPEKDSLFVMAGLVPAIYVFLAAATVRRGCPGQARA
jgi:hypothetical protein